MPDTVLTGESITVRFGGLVAVSDIDLEAPARHVLGVIGPNGAGKTTLFNCLSGLVRATSGRITFLSHDVTQLPTHQRARMGMTRSFQLGGLIPDLTVAENVAVGVDQRYRIEGSRQPRKKETVSETHDVIARLGLEDVRDEVAINLASGTRREVEVARCVAAGARMVMLDEPGVGLTPEEREELKGTVRRLAEQDVAVLITDHDTDIVFSVSDHVLAMDQGAEIAFGRPDEVRQDPAVIDAYLGAESDEEADS